ncbi:hypothetical protein [Alienimonas californiensis]|uniref:Uncharacterized protein n=1 Tax=Alienimonas californiensis TaxID=2527989 RepID=A0A517PB37_9PLAN|nr:hypothetical protein [Alienimonas californiensis]QDT16584.1 hypothetical protein CA12_26900 [Alienimonas californiensis]
MLIVYVATVLLLVGYVVLPVGLLLYVLIPSRRGALRRVCVLGCQSLRLGVACLIGGAVSASVRDPDAAIGPSTLAVDLAGLLLGTLLMFVLPSGIGRSWRADALPADRP